MRDAPPLDAARIDQVVTALCERVGGEWLLVGGALVALWLDGSRVTEDVDVIGVGGGADRLALLGLAQELGLPVESVNSAADFFVRRIEGWRGELEELRSGPRGRVLRPTPTLFVLLKLGRLSEHDLEDCRTLLARAAADGLRLDGPRLAAALDALPDTADAALVARRRELRAALGRALRSRT